MQVPADRGDTVLLLTVHMSPVNELKVTGSPEVAEALTAPFAPPYVRVGAVPKLINWLTGTIISLSAEQFATVPPSLPLHVQLQGPLPVTSEVLPAEQRYVVGTTLNVPPLLVPQAPLTGMA